mmetsp:Transcript_18211/g.47500  ORF Transcript_18211/g.47500 Transcript_18211/m.47500 type:complete len:283 (+) Transcript_18211:104-952(+)
MVPAAVMPRLLYGTAWKEGRTAGLVAKAIAAGFRGVDTACQPRHYNEGGVGDGLRKALTSLSLSRDELWVQTKFTPLPGHDHRVPYDPSAAMVDQVAESLEVSLGHLGGYLDCLLLHSPLPTVGETLRVWHALEALTVPPAAGAGSRPVRSVGLSNIYNVDALRLILDEANVPPAVVQNRFYAATGYDSDLRRLCTERGIRYQAFWTLTANPGVVQSRAVGRVASRLGCANEEAFFGWCYAEGITVLSGTTSPIRMATNVASLDLSLSPDDCAEIRHALEHQ